MSDFDSRDDRCLYVFERLPSVGNVCMWWRRNNDGHTSNLNEARRFNREEAKVFAYKLCDGEYRAWPETNAEAVALVTVDPARHPDGRGRRWR